MTKYKLVSVKSCDDSYNTIFSDLGLHCKRTDYDLSYCDSTNTAFFECPRGVKLSDKLAELITKGYTIKHPNYDYQYLVISKNKETCYLYLSKKKLDDHKYTALKPITYKVICDNTLEKANYKSIRDNALDKELDKAKKPVPEKQIEYKLDAVQTNYSYLYGNVLSDLGLKNIGTNYNYANPAETATLQCKGNDELSEKLSALKSKGYSVTLSADKNCLHIKDTETKIGECKLFISSNFFGTTEQAYFRGI